MSSKKPLKVALVCDWLTNVGGAERVLKSLSDLFPSAPIYTSQYNQKKINWFSDRDVRVGWLQIFPSSFRRFLGPLRQLYFSHLNLSAYDLIISVTGAEAKSVKFDPKTTRHLCYCHVPTQYYWGLKEDYEKNPGFGFLNPLVRLALKILLPPLRRADLAAASRPTKFITISTYAASQIKKFYGRDSVIIFPPVGVKTLILVKPRSPEKASHPRRGFVTTSRQVSWKRLDLAVKACLNLNLPLTLVGSGPEHSRLKKLVKKSKNPRAAQLITFAPETDRAGLKRYLESAEGFIFPSLEPFGIAPLEALACGCPVIAYGRGGALDYVIDGENGVLFGKQTVSSLSQALKRFRTLSFSEPKLRVSALPFDESVFVQSIKSFIATELTGKPQPLSKQPEKIRLSSRPSTKSSSPALKPTQKPKPTPKTASPSNSAVAPKSPRPAQKSKPLSKPNPAPVKAQKTSAPPQSAQKVKPTPRPAPPQNQKKVKQGNKLKTPQTATNVKQIQISAGGETPNSTPSARKSIKIN